MCPCCRGSGEVTCPSGLWDASCKACQGRGIVYHEKRDPAPNETIKEILDEAGL